MWHTWTLPLCPCKIAIYWIFFQKLDWLFPPLHWGILTQNLLLFVRRIAFESMKILGLQSDEETAMPLLPSAKHILWQTVISSFCFFPSLCYFHMNKPKTHGERLQCGRWSFLRRLGDSGGCDGAATWAILPGSRACAAQRLLLGQLLNLLEGRRVILHDTKVCTIRSKHCAMVS